jgi:hypothetical protein
LGVAPRCDQITDVRLAAAALVVLLLAACGGNATRARFERHLKADASLVAHCCATLATTAQLRAAHRQVHAATVDLAAVAAPPDAQADKRTILAGFRFADTLLAKLAHDIARGDGRAFLTDGEAFRKGAGFRGFDAAVRDLQRKGYDVGLLGR